MILPHAQHHLVVAKQYGFPCTSHSARFEQRHVDFAIFEALANRVRAAFDVEPTPAHRTAEVESTKTMISRVEAQFDIKPERLIGDTAYGTAPMLAWMVEEKDIEPHVPVWDKTERKNDSFSSNDFHWDEEAEEYRCPVGNALRSEWRAFKNERSHVTKANTIIFRSRQTDCVACPMKAKCCPNTSFRKIARSVHEAARDVARRIAATPAYQRSRHECKKVEMLFAHLKRILKLDRLRLRGMSGATDEFTLAGRGAEPATAGQTDLSRATAHGIGASARSKKPQINPITEQQRSTKRRKTTQRGE